MTPASPPDRAGTPDDETAVGGTVDTRDPAPASSDFEAASVHAISPMRRAMKRFARNPVGMAGLIFLLFLVFLTLFGGVLMKHDPLQQQFIPFEGPSGQNWLGTDDVGRDLASRLIKGTSVSMQAAFLTVGAALAVALPIGLLAGYRGGWVDNVFMRATDGILSFPPLALALVIAKLLGPGLFNAMLAIWIVFIPPFVRLIRASTLAVTQETFVEASRSIGTRTHAIILRRILPSVVSPIIVLTSLVLGAALIVEASLGFLGLGVQRPDPSWGNMLRDGFSFIFSHPFELVPPGIAVALTVLAFNMVGDALRDALGLAETTPPPGAKRGRIGLTLVDRPTPADAARAGDETPAPAAVEGTGEPSGSPAGTVATHRPEPGTPAGAADVLLSVRNLTVEFATEAGPVTVVDDLTFNVRRGEVVGLLGESGSGKTVTSMAIMRLLLSPPARVTGGQVLFDGQDLLQLSFKELARERGNSLSMVFQDPMSSLNPAFTIGNQLAEAVRLHDSCSKEQARRRAVEMLEHVGIPDPVGRMKEYPHRLSGGMRQRVLIAMALANHPKLLIADEPTTALDVTVQAQILDLLKSLQSELHMAMIFVSHDLGVIADIADRALVMYAGQIVEAAEVGDLFGHPKHPYTRKLLEAIPQTAPVGSRLPFIAGVVPTPGQWPVGCRFASRCDLASAECREAPIELTRLGERSAVRCIKSGALTAGSSR